MRRTVLTAAERADNSVTQGAPALLHILRHAGAVIIKVPPLPLAPNRHRVALNRELTHLLPRRFRSSALRACGTGRLATDQPSHLRLRQGPS
jgi:hypothetical protein